MKYIVSQNGIPVSLTDIKILEALVILNKAKYSMKNSG